MPLPSLRSMIPLLLCLAGSLALQQQAHALTLRAQATQRGDFALVGNTLAHDCAPGVPAPVVGTVGACGTNTADTAPDVFWQSGVGNAVADTTVTAANAGSTAVLNLPAGATVTHAWLYWAATRAAGADTSVQLQVPGGSTQAVTALPADAVNDAASRYRVAADVTTLVRTHGTGAYRVSGVDADALANANDSGRVASWWMVVLYQLNSAPVRHLAVYDGLESISNGFPATTTVSGFQVPGTVGSAKLGVVALDGDSTLAGDQLQVNGVALSDPLNPANDFFNATRSWLGSAVSVAGDLPQLSGGPYSMSGLDLDVVDIAARLSPGDTSATVLATSSSDAFLHATLVSAIEVAQPLLAGTLAVADLNGAALMPGDTLEYTLTVRNDGSGAATQVLVSDVLPAGLTYVPGSLAITAGANAGALTDATGDDPGDYNAGTRRFTVRLGTGASGATGGTLAAAETTTVRLRATVDALCSGDRTYTSQAQISAGNATSALTDGNTGTAGLQATEASLSVRCLSATASGPGTVSGSSGAVATGATATLTATPNAGAFFQQWSGGATGTTNPLSVVMNADQAITANFSALAAQAITGFAATPAAPPYVAGSSFTVAATGGGSGQPVVFNSSTPAICTVAGSSVTMHAAGVCTLAANQAGNGQYLAAPTATLTLYLGVPAPSTQSIPALGPWGLLALAALVPLLGRRRLG